VSHTSADEVTHNIGRFEEHAQFPGVLVGLAEDPIIEGIAHTPFPPPTAMIVPALSPLFMTAP